MAGIMVRRSCPRTVFNSYFMGTWLLNPAFLSSSLIFSSWRMVLVPITYHFSISLSITAIIFIFVCKDSANRAKYQMKTCFSLNFRDAAYLRLIFQAKFVQIEQNNMMNYIFCHFYFVISKIVYIFATSNLKLIIKHSNEAFKVISCSSGLLSNFLRETYVSR